MQVVLGGTFDPLHNGHKALFERAFALCRGDKLIVGLTSDSMAQMTRARMVQPFKKRKELLEGYINEMLLKFPGTEVDIIEIDDIFNKPITQEIVGETLVVSEGRMHIAEQTNVYRKKNGLAPLEIIAVPYVLADDGLPIKATRIYNGEIDETGKLLGKIKIAIGTSNDVKINAVTNIFKKIYKDIEIEVLKIKVNSGVPEQPKGAETITGATNRAKGAIKQFEQAQFGIGIEAGLFKFTDSDKCYDVQYCVIIDRGGRLTIGHGPGFYYPQSVVDSLKKGKTVGEAMEMVTGIKDIGQKQGAIGYLTNNILTREELTEQAVLMAMVPRLTNLY